MTGRVMAALLLAASTAADAASVLERVIVVPGSSVSVTLRLSAPVHPVVRTLPGDAESAARVYLDFPDTILDAAAPAVVGGDTRALLRVRAGQFDASTTRVVLDLSSALPYRVHDADTTVTVDITPPRATTPPTPHVATTVPAPPRPAAIAPPPQGPIESVPPASAAAATPPTPTATTPAPARVASPAPSPSPTTAAARTRPDPVAAVPAPPDAGTAPDLPPPDVTAPGVFPEMATAPAQPPPAPPVRPRPGPPFALTPPPPVDRPLVVLDAGHGGHDPGAIGLGGIVEKTVTLDFAQRVAARLAAELPVDVVLTRDDDTYVPIDARVERASEASLFVSLHANAAENPRLSGVEVFYGGGGIEAAAAGPLSPERLGRDVAEAIEHGLAPIRTTVRPGRFGVLSRNAVPSILIEVGYLTNSGDVARIGDETYRGLVAQAIVDGAAAFLRAPGAARRARRAVAAAPTCPRGAAACRPGAQTSARSAARS